MRKTLKEIGGFIPFEQFHNKMLYDGGIKLNCGRNALKFLVRARKIKKILIPYFLCDSVEKALIDENVEVLYYHIGWDFKLVLTQTDLNSAQGGTEIEQGKGTISEGAKRVHQEENRLRETYIYLVNFYGQISNSYIREFHVSHPNLIVDNVQSYFQEPLEGIDTIYSCRKYFGVSDGAILFSDAKLGENIGTDISYQRMHYVLGGFERPESEFFKEHDRKNNDIFEQEPIKRMSSLTENILHGIDYEFIKKRRTENFSFLHEALGSKNRLKLTIPDGAFMYPFYTENAEEIRIELFKQHIYIPQFWEEVLSITKPDDIEYKLTKNILPLPVDQRYDTKTMRILAEKLSARTVPVTPIAEKLSARTVPVTPMGFRAKA